MAQHVIPFCLIEAVQLDARIHGTPLGIVNKHGDIFSLSSILTVLYVVRENIDYYYYSVIIVYTE